MNESIKSWKIWWEGTLKRVNPDWQVGATLEWENGDEGKILDFHPLKELTIMGNLNEISTWSFTADRPGSTVVGIEVDLSNSLVRETGPGAMEIELQTPLSKLKEYIES